MLKGCNLETYKQAGTRIETIELAEQLIQVIKKYKPTYDQAYVSLEIAREQLEYESNFVQVAK